MSGQPPRGAHDRLANCTRKYVRAVNMWLVFSRARLSRGVYAFGFVCAEYAYDVCAGKSAADMPGGWLHMVFIGVWIFRNVPVR